MLSDWWIRLTFPWVLGLLGQPENKLCQNKVKSKFNNTIQYDTKWFNFNPEHTVQKVKYKSTKNIGDFVVFSMSDGEKKICYKMILKSI